VVCVADKDNSSFFRKFAVETNSKTTTGSLVTIHNNCMAKLVDASPKEIRTMARNGSNGGNSCVSHVSQRLPSNPDLINEFFFAAISTTSDYNRVNVFFIKYDVLVFVPLQVFVMYQNILASLIVNCSRVYKARATAYLTYFHLSRTSVVCILQDMVTSFPNVSIVCVKTLLFTDAYFIFVTVNFRV